MPFCSSVMLNAGDLVLLAVNSFTVFFIVVTASPAAGTAVEIVRVTPTAQVLRA